MKVLLALTASTLFLTAPTWAHDFGPDIAKFNAAAATKKLESEQAINAKLALERAIGEMEQADVRMLLRIRSLTNAGFKALGEQPAFLTSEVKRLETALASPKTTDAAKIAAARDIVAQLSAEMKVYTTLENMAVDQMKQALQLIESAPGK